MISVVVPAFNEQENLFATVDSLRAAAGEAGDVDLEIIIVNDGSADDTGRIADGLAAGDARVRVIHQAVNRGLGAGLTAALAVAKYPKFMCVPGDNDVPRDMLAQMMMRHADADLVLGYFLNKEVRGRRRNVLSTLYNVIYMISFDIFIQYVNGPAIYPTALLRQITLRANRFSVISEATIKCLRRGCAFYEVGGYMRNGLQGSTSLSLRNLNEVAVSFVRLVTEIHVRQRAAYSFRPKRVKPLCLAPIEPEPGRERTPSALNQAKASSVSLLSNQDRTVSIGISMTRSPSGERRKPWRS